MSRHAFDELPYFGSGDRVCTCGCRLDPVCDPYIWASVKGYGDQDYCEECAGKELVELFETIGEIMGVAQ